MSPKDALLLGIKASEGIINAYIGDLDDSEILVRPLPGMTHIAQQLGHLISAERYFMELVRPGTSPALPAGFEEAHSKEAARSEDDSKYLTRAEYQDLATAQRNATLAILESLPEAELDRTDPEKYPAFAPSVAALFGMVGTHALMHCGQFVAVRRKLGKPVVI